MRTVNISGIDTTFDDANQVVALSQYGNKRWTIRIGDKVVSNGRIFMPYGSKGQVVGLDEPFRNGLTDDCILVHFKGHRGSISMKFKDLIDPTGPNPGPHPEVARRAKW